MWFTIKYNFFFNVHSQIVKEIISLWCNRNYKNIFLKGARENCDKEKISVLYVVNKINEVCIIFKASVSLLTLVFFFNNTFLYF